MNSATLDNAEAEDFSTSREAFTPNPRPTTRPNPRPNFEPEPEPEENETPGTEMDPSKNADDGAKKSGHRLVFAALAAVVVVAGLAIYYVRFIAPFESTDDAFIEAHVAPIAPQVAGRIERLLVEDNQLVKAGDVLVQIDPRDYQARLDQEHANLASAQNRQGQAKAQFEVDKAKIEQEKANLTAAEAEAKRAATDSKRYQSVGSSAFSQSEIDLAATQARSTAAQVLVARNKELAAEAQAKLDEASIEAAAAEVKKSEAAVRQAELDLSYTQVKAHEAGYVTHRTIEADSYVQPGQALLAIVPQEVWVVANFKETQLKHMRSGQKVSVKVDAYPNMKFSGHVDSIQAGTGPRFSLLPPENASGNYVKVVQRVPVKIVLDDLPRDGRVLGAGMSVVPEVRVN